MTLQDGDNVGGQSSHSEKNNQTKVEEKPRNFYLEELSNFTYTGKYARYREKDKRREMYEETSDRVLDMHIDRFNHLPKEYKKKIVWAFDKVKDKLVAPSMRSMQFGGKAVIAHEARLFNCSAGHIDSIRSFSEAFYLLLCGVGVTGGFSEKFLSRLPKLVSKADKTGTVVAYIVEDTIEGWADSMEAILMCYFKNTPYSGRKIAFDYSKIRKKGLPLKTSGGKAPGHQGLKEAHKKIKELLDYIIEVKGQTELLDINAYDIIMHCADAVLSGGIRRAATAAIFQKNQQRMIEAKISFPVKKMYGFEKNEKTGKWEGYVVLDETHPSVIGSVNLIRNNYLVSMKDKEYEWVKSSKTISWVHIEPQRGRSNNSVILVRGQFTEEEFKKIFDFTQQWGEPAFVFADHPDTLFNPCFEISFIPVTKDGRCGFQFCNLSTVNGAKVNTFEDFLEAVEAATVIGSIQACYTNYPYLNKAAKELTEEEALLGVSITGMMDNPAVLLNPRNQYLAAQFAVKVNKEWSEVLGIKQAARITCLKPEGTTSLVFGSASGIHPHHARRYFRRIQMNKLDPVYKFFKKHNPELCEESVHSANKTDDVVLFPVEVGKNAMVKEDLKAIDHLNIIRETQENWVRTGTTAANQKPITHNVSCTVVVKQDEWDDVVKYLYQHQNNFAAVSFLANTGDKMYQQPPLEKILPEDEARWAEVLRTFKSVNYSKLIEEEDKTDIQSVVACGANGCDTVEAMT